MTTRPLTDRLTIAAESGDSDRGTSALMLEARDALVALIDLAQHMDICQECADTCAFKCFKISDEQRELVRR